MDPQKSLDDNQNNDQEPGNKTDKQNVPGNNLSIITASAGLLLGLSIAYFAGTAALPIIGAVAVFIAVAIVGASVGYGVGKVSQKLFVESINEHSKQELKV